MAYHVTGANWTNTLAFWTNYFGFGAVTVSNNFALIKINDQQYVELYQGPLDPVQFQLVNFGFQVTDAEACRESLASNGVSVPPAVTTNALGNLSFFTTDPDGHLNEWVQYLTNSVHRPVTAGRTCCGHAKLFWLSGGLSATATADVTAADGVPIRPRAVFPEPGRRFYLPRITTAPRDVDPTHSLVHQAVAGIAAEKVSW